MKLLIVLLCLVLCGCTHKTPETEPQTTTAPTAAAVETEPISMYDPENPLEESHQGALKVYPLTMRKVQGIRGMKDGLLVFSGYGSTTITMLTGEELFVTASTTLDFELDPTDPSLQIGDETFSFYDPVRQETLVFNESLTEVSRIPVEDNLVGSPILSSDRNTLYYCTSYAIRAWNLETGIHRTIKELTYDDQALMGLHLNDTVLQCRIRDGETVQTLFLATDTGRLVSQQDGDMALITRDTQYYASLPASGLEMLIFGEASGLPRVLYPEDPAAQNFYLPQNHAVVTASVLSDERIALRYYELDTGICRSELLLDALQDPKSVVNDSDGSVYILVYDPASDCDTIYRWEFSDPVFAPETADGMVYTEDYSAENSINYEALAQCQSYAAELSEKYGIQVLVWEDALAVQPWDYEFEAESLARVLYQELALLDQRLSRYPAGILEKTASHFTSLKLCLVRQITGTAASGSLDTATGIQFLDGTDAYVVITVGKYSEQALYHEFYHAMETHILNESPALDQWEELNPSGFEYTYGYRTITDADTYLSGEGRAFVDTYSMSFPKEDRARILENAMLSGNEALFDPPIMQAKLTKLCEGIRQAFGLRKSEETFPLEQYLEKSLAYSE